MSRVLNFFRSLLQKTFFVRGYVLMGAGVVIIGALVTIPPGWEYSNSTSFCGTTCHTMPPEYKTYQISPHARVLCVDCHIGRDWIAVQFSRKIGHTRLVAATLLDRYEYPIRTHSMRPARDTCEQCHFPQKFSDDSMRIIPRYENNRANDAYAVYLLMHTGGGNEREGLGRGIHWHVENTVSYIALDKDEQDIPWVRVETPDGQVTDYNAINSPIDTSNLDQYEIHVMDCVTCHNRISHLIDTPQDAVDKALAQGDISTDIPFIRVRAVELLSGVYATSEEAVVSIETLDQYYRDYYSDFYAEGSAKVADAITALTEIYKQNNFPEQELSWQTHPDNIGHLNFPGCFRCHDGEHFSTAGTTIRLECNLCHSIPQIVTPDQIEPTLPLATGLEPQTHLDSTWITRHHLSLDATCSNCHTVSNPGGTDNSSFCSNSACHGNKWEFAGFDAPGMATILGLYQFEAEPLLQDFTGAPTYSILQPLFEQECGACHGPTPSKGLRVVDYAGLMAGSESGVVVVPGSPDDSLIVQTLEGGHFASLTKRQMELLRQWISDGAPEN